MAKIEIHYSGGKNFKINVNSGDTLLRAISDAGVYFDAPCGGEGRCGKCLVRTAPDGEEVLACRTYIDGDMRIYLPTEAQMKIADTVESPNFYHVCHSGRDSESSEASGNQGSPLGVAIDIGTTTVVACLIDCGTGRVISTASGVNAQRIYGADVITRINYCMANGHEKLTKLIRAQIEELLSQLSISWEQAQINNIVIAGNTIMQHLVCGYSPVSMGIVPFEPTNLFGKEFPAWKGLPLSPDAKIYYTPAIAAYIGGDITAGLLAIETGFNFSPGGREVNGQTNSNLWTTGPQVDGQANPNFCRSATEVETAGKTLLFLDIGTNGEIVLKHGGRYYCCATAAGPAFEGAQIEMGMAALSGAISHAAWNEEEKRLKFKVIGEAEPIGICGSGLLDILAYLVENSKRAELFEEEPALPLVDETGRLVNDTSITKDADRLYLTSKVYITSQDVRKLQLAKAAIAAGIQTLLQHAGITERQIDSLILAGGFGNYLDKTSAAKIGLIPQSLLPVAQAAGNTALSGAIYALSDEEAYGKLENIRERMEYIELSTSKVFNESFVEQMMF